MSSPGTRGEFILPSLLQQELLSILQTQGYRKLDAPVRLASGALSSDFIDGKEALAEWRDLRTASEAIVETVTSAGHSFDAVGGLTMGADALAVGIAAVSDGLVPRLLLGDWRCCVLRVGRSVPAPLRCLERRNPDEHMRRGER